MKHCDFCGTKTDNLVTGPRVTICHECTDLSKDIFKEREREKSMQVTDPEERPKVVSIDEYRSNSNAANFLKTKSAKRLDLAIANLLNHYSMRQIQLAVSRVSKRQKSIKKAA